MSIEKINEAEFAMAGVSALPIRPNSSYGGTAMSATQLRAAFDRAPTMVMQKLNELVDAINAAAENEKSLARQIFTGLSSGHTLYDLIKDITSGELAKYLYVGETALHNQIADIHTGQKNAVERITYDIGKSSIVYTTFGGEEITVSLSESGIDDYIQKKKNEIEELIIQKLDTFSQIDFGGQDAIFTVEADRECALSGFSSLTLALPSAAAGFCGIVHFTVAVGVSITVPTAISVSDGAEEGVVYLGDDSVDGIFTPCIGYRYTLMFIHDGDKMTCTVNRRAA